MVNLANRAEVLSLLDELAGAEDQLTPNEREMVSQIKTKYETPDAESFDDKICLEVILRNIGIRNGFGMKPNEAATRTIDLPRKEDD